MPVSVDIIIIAAILAYCAYVAVRRFKKKNGGAAGACGGG